MTALFLQLDKEFTEQLSDYQFERAKDIDRSSDTAELNKYLEWIHRHLTRWMHIQCHSENNVFSALFIDRLFKSLVIKIDRIIRVKRQQRRDLNKKCEERLEDMKEFCEKRLQ